MSTPSMRFLGVALTILICVPALFAVEIADFQVNEENFPGVFSQDQSSAASAADGDYVVCWRDGRNGDDLGYYQLFDAGGQPLSSNRLIDDLPIANDGGPWVAMNSAGEFVVCYRALTSTVWARFFAANGDPLGEPFVIVNDQGEWGGFRELDIALNDAGHGVLISRAQHDGDPTYLVLGQLFDLSSGPVGEPFQISGEFPAAAGHSAEVTIDASDRVFCAYCAYADQVGIPDFIVLLSRFSYDDPSSVTETTVDAGYLVEGEVYYEINAPFLAYHPDGYLGILWTGTTWEPHGTNSWSYLADTSFISVFDPEGAVLSERVPLLTGESFPGYDWRTDLAATATGFAVMSTTVVDPDFPVLELDKYGTPQYPVKIYTSGDDSEHEYAWSMIYPTDNLVVFIWEGAPYTEPYANIYHQGFALDATEVFSMARVHDDAGSWQSFPAVATDNNGNALVVWIDNRNSALGDVYGQILDPNGNPIGDNFRISDDPLGEGFAREVTISGNGADRVVVVWTGNGESHYAVRAQVFDIPLFTPVGGNFIVHEPDDYNLKDFWPDVGVLADKSMVFVWRDRLGSSDRVYNTYAQEFTAGATPTGSVIKVNESEGTELCMGCESLYFDYAPRIAMRSDGRFAIVWMETLDLGGYSTVNCTVAQFYADWGSPIGPNVLISNEANGVQMISDQEIPPEVVVNSFGEYAFAWTGGHNSAYYGGWARVFDSNGAPQGAQVRYADYHDYNHAVTASIIAGPDHSFLCSWNNSVTDDANIYAQKLISTCELEGTVARIDNAAAGSEQSYPTMSSFNGTVLFVWQDFRNGTGNADVFSRYIEWGKIGISYGDVNLDGLVNVTDVVYLIAYIFNDGPEPVNYYSGDTNCDGIVNITDAVYLVQYIFSGGPEPSCD
ncbi:MAG: dockerin type I repeat-containing protein [bacterium]